MVTTMEMFSAAEQSRIRDTVRQAERATQGEIVPVVVRSSGHYREARHVAGLIVGLLTLALILCWDYWWGGWGWSFAHPGWALLATAGAYLFGTLVGSIPTVIRWLTSDERRHAKVSLRAQLAFHQHGIPRTREGTGILIFLSLLERRVQILADRGINERVPAGTWERLVDHIVAGMRQAPAVEPLCQAIAECGDLLATYYPAKPDNPDELSNEVRQDR